jgi:hypothetical protein
MLRFYLAVAVYLALISTNSWTQEKAQPELLVAAAADLNPALQTSPSTMRRRLASGSSFPRSVLRAHSAN